MERYQRQMILPGFGREGQRKLQDGKVLIVGAGGLGSPVALYLAGAGVGTIGLVDDDVVSLTNLHRQIIHPAGRLGVNKALSAKETMQAINDQVKVITCETALTADNAEDIIRDYDFVVDAVDNFETKFLINDTCVRLRIPFCHGGIVGLQGQAMTWVPEDGPCYRCIFEEVPEPGSVPTCREAGIMGPAVGVIGCVQALEAVKYLTGMGQLLTGRMFYFDGLSMKTRIMKFPNPRTDCPACGKDREE